MMLEIIYRKIEELKPNDKNPRQISKADLNKLKRSIQEFGFVDPVIVNQHPDRLDVIVGGHQRVKAATELGMQSVPCVYINVSEAKENIFNIALNEISGDWDEVKLQALLKEINSTPGVDITLTGFDEPIIDEILSSTEQEQKEALIDEAPPVLAEPKTRPGEIYQLGRHRLMCGDSTKDEDMDRLTGGGAHAYGMD